MGNGALQNEPHNKKLMHNYLRKLFSTTFSKYSKVNPRRKMSDTVCCIISITSK